MAFIGNSITRIGNVTVSPLSLLDHWVTQSGCTHSNQTLLCFALLNMVFQLLFTQECLSLVVLKLFTQVVWPSGKQSAKLTGIHVLSYSYGRFAIKAVS